MASQTQKLCAVVSSRPEALTATVVPSVYTGTVETRKKSYLQAVVGVDHDFHVALKVAPLDEVHPHAQFLIDCHKYLASINERIAIGHANPTVVPLVQDLYLEKLRTEDLIDFYTPPPPVRLIIEEFQVMDEDQAVFEKAWEDFQNFDEYKLWAWVKAQMPSNKLSDKNKRKRRNVSLRKAAARDDLRVIEQFAEQQSGQDVRLMPLCSRNILALRARGLLNHEIEDLLRSRSFDRVLFSTKQINRIYRDILQVRTALLRTKIARERLDHNVIKAEIQRTRAIERCAKYAENQSLGSLINVASVACMGISAALASINVCRTVKGVRDKTPGFVDQITCVLRKFASSVSELGTLAKAVLTAAFIYYVFMTFKHPLIRAAVITAIPLIFVGNLKELLIDFFSQINGNTEIVTQSIEDDGDGLLPGLIATTVLGQMAMEGNKGLRAGMVDAVGKLPRTVKGIEFLMDFVIQAMQRCVNVVLRWLGRPEVRFRKELSAEVEKQISIANELDDKMRSATFDNRDSPKMFQKCSECYARLSTLMLMHHENIKVRTILSPYKACMAGHIGTLRSTLGRGAGFRQEPLSVMIESSPGVGKTMQVPVLIGTVLYEAGLVSNISPDTLHECFFSRPANSDFFDGYFGQECYLIDDIFARKPNPNGLTQFDEVMAFYGTTTCMLNMADLPKKGMYPFTSSLIMMTTNLKNLDEVGVGAILIEPEAFKRRVDIHVHIEVREEYQLKTPGPKGRLDFSLFEQECRKLHAEGKRGVDAHPWYMWEAWDTYFGNMNSDFKPGTGRCFSEVCKEMIAGLKQKTAFHKGNMEHLKNVFWREPVAETTPSTSLEPAGLAHVVEVQSGHAVTRCDSSGGSDNSSQVSLFSHSDDSSEHRFSLVTQFLEWMKATKPSRLFDSKDSSLASLIMKTIGLYSCYQTIRCILIPIVKGLIGFFRGAQETLVGESQSNGPKPKKLIIQSPVMQVADFSLWEKPYNSSYKMLVDVGGMSYAPFGQIIFLNGNVAVMPHHFLHQIDTMKAKNEISDNSKLLFKPADGYVTVESTIRAFLSYPNYSLPEHDLHFICFKKGFRMYPDITKFLVKEADLALLSGRRVRLDTAAADDDGVMLPNCNRNTYISDSVRFETTILRTTTRKYDRYFSYTANTSAGDCGAPLCITDYRNFNNRLFLGIHVAGMTSHSRGYATPLTYEIVQKAMDRFKHLMINYTDATIEESGLPQDIVLQCIDTLPFGEEGKFGNAIPLYETSKPVSVPVKSALQKTFIGLEETFKDNIALMNDGHEPPVLVPMKMGRYVDKESGQTVYPMAEALRPYVEGVFLPVDNSFTIGLNAGLKAFADATRDYSAPILTPQEAVLGVPQLGLKSITRATSVGYPLCTFAKNKKYFFGSEDDLDVTTEEANELFLKIENLLSIIKLGKRPLFVCRDFLKDEVRKVGKKARLIAGTDLTYYLICRMYFGAFVGAVGRSHEASGMCLGMNPYSEWGHLRRMLEKPDPTGRNVWDGDFAGFDSSQMPQLLWECLEYINNWYSTHGGSDEENYVRTILFLDLAYSRHITGFHGPCNTIVEWSKSLPSGHFLTSTINSMLSMGLVASGFVAMTGEVDFWGNCAAISLGDDNVVSTSDKYVDVFNQVTLSAFIKNAYGMEYTAGRKGEALRPVVGIDQVVFLQRRWAVKNGLDVCPIRPESFLHSLYYVHSKDEAQNRETLLAGIELAFEELSMHEERYWRPVADKLIRLKNVLGEAPNHSTMSSDAYLSIVKSRVPSYI